MTDKEIEEKKKKLEKVKIPPICTFKGVRKIVLQRVWDKADKLEKEGKPMLVGDFGRLMAEKWDEVKKEIPVLCQTQPVKAEDLGERSPDPTYSEEIEGLTKRLEDLKKQASESEEPAEEPAEKVAEKVAEAPKKTSEVPAEVPAEAPKKTSEVPAEVPAEKPKKEPKKEPEKEPEKIA